MKKGVNLLMISAMLMFVVACQDVIDVDLNDSTAKIVIEGSISNQNDGCQVILSQTISFDETNDFPTVSGAEVILSDGTQTYELTESDSGTYVNDEVRGTPGVTYELTVEVDGTVYTATSTMPRPVRIDSLQVLVDPDNIFLAEDEMYLEIKFQDPVGEENFYHTNVWINDENKALTTILDDDFNDGEVITSTVLSQGDVNDDPEFVSGDRATVFLYAIDEDVYEYYRTLNALSSAGTAPANPTSNFDNGALGFFSAHAISKQEVHIP